MDSRGHSHKNLRTTPGKSASLIEKTPFVEPESVQEEATSERQSLQKSFSLKPEREESVIFKFKISKKD